MLIAMTRPVSGSLARCELTHLDREPIDVGRAREQHAAYEELLASLGATLEHVAEAPELPDAVFVEDTAVVVDEVAVVTRPGAASRRDEPAGVAAALAAHRPIRTMTPPATLDGGDVMRLERTLYVGRSSRTSQEGIDQLRSFLAPFGYEVVPVDFRGCLHLKSAVTAVGKGLLLLNPAWVSAAPFAHAEALHVDAREPYAANALRVADTVIHPSEFPRTRERLMERGLVVAPTPCGEISKAEGAVTCCSILIPS